MSSTGCQICLYYNLCGVKDENFLKTFFMDDSRLNLLHYSGKIFHLRAGVFARLCGVKAIKVFFIAWREILRLGEF